MCNPQRNGTSSTSYPPDRQCTHTKFNEVVKVDAQCSFKHIGRQGTCDRTHKDIWFRVALTGFGSAPCAQEHGVCVSMDS